MQPTEQPGASAATVVEAHALLGFRVWVRFADGTEGEDDLSHLVGVGVFRRWQLSGVYERLEVDPNSGTVVWPGGLDIAPDALYERITSRSRAAAR